MLGLPAVLGRDRRTFTRHPFILLINSYYLLHILTLIINYYYRFLLIIILITISSWVLLLILKAALLDFLKQAPRAPRGAAPASPAPARRGSSRWNNHPERASHGVPHAMVSCTFHLISSSFNVKFIYKLCSKTQ